MKIFSTVSFLLAACLLGACGGSSEPENTEVSAAPVSEKTVPVKSAPIAVDQKQPVIADQKEQAAESQPSITRTREAVDPSAALMNWIFADWAGVDPQLEKTASINAAQMRMYDGTKVNEFTRADVEAKELARLQGLYQDSKGYGTIIANIGGSLSKYDFDYGEFYIGQFSPSSTVNFGYVGGEEYRHVEQLLQGVQLVNALDAYVWKVPRDHAEKVINMFEEDNNTNMRYIYTRVKLTILGADADKGLLQARIDSFELYTDPKYTATKSPRKLAEASF